MSRRLTIYALALLVCAFCLPVPAAAQEPEMPGQAGQDGTSLPVQPAISDSLTLGSAELADFIVEEALKMKGTPYRYGAVGPKYYDCSAFTRLIYGKAGIQLERSAIFQSRQGRPVEGSLSNLQKGDLLIFGSRHNPRRIGHTGIFMEMDSTGTDFTFVHIARVGGVIVSHYKESYYKQRFLLARRLLPDFLTPEPSDSLAGYAFNPENSVLPLKDTLQLAAGDSLIVLLQDGRWLYAGRDGALTVPGQGEKLVLDPDGSWTRISMTKHTVPAPKPANGSVSAVKADGSAAATDPDSQPVYYTVKSGDTLSKIAMRHHTTVRSLCRLNGISENTTLKIGRKLRIR